MSFQHSEVSLKAESQPRVAAKNLWISLANK
jgi:hypothetical protein